jgi:hypothetical protein
MLILLCVYMFAICLFDGLSNGALASFSDLAVQEYKMASLHDTGRYICIC